MRPTQALGLVLISLSMSVSPEVGAQTRDKGPWWPHPLWGPEDEAGASNWITAEKILEGVRSVRTGKVYELGYVYESGMPLLGQRAYKMTLVGWPTYGPEDGLLDFDEILCTEIGQIGTQLDGLGHVGVRMKMSDETTKDVFYNGFTSDEIYSPYGLKKLGVEKLKPILTRGILVDVAGYKQVEALPKGYKVTLADVRGSLARQGLVESAIKPGDAIFVRSGWSKFWNDPAKYLDGWPEVTREVGDWVVERKASVLGEDVGTEEIHENLVTHHGVLLLEFLTLSELAQDRAYEFLFVFTPMRFKGATGSPGRPLAIR